MIDVGWNMWSLAVWTAVNHGWHSWVTFPNRRKRELEGGLVGGWGCLRESRRQRYSTLAPAPPWHAPSYYHLCPTPYNSALNQSCLFCNPPSPLSLISTSSGAGGGEVIEPLPWLNPAVAGQWNTATIFHLPLGYYHHHRLKKGWQMSSSQPDCSQGSSWEVLFTVSHYRSPDRMATPSN